MPSLTTESFVNKRDAVERFNRSHRSLSRDITTAVKLADAETLQHFRLQTQDSQVREGTEVTIEILDELRDAGQVPTWWADPEYLVQRYGRRGEDSPSVANSKKTDPGYATSEHTKPHTEQASVEGRPALPVDPTVRAIVLEHLHHNDQQHARDTKRVMDRILQLVETNQQLQGQTNELFNQFQEALKEGGGLRNLIAGSVATKSAAMASSKSPANRNNPDANVVDVQSVSAAKKPAPKKPSTTKKRTTPKKSSRRKKPASKKKAPPKPTPFWKKDVRELIRFGNHR